MALTRRTYLVGGSVLLTLVILGVFMFAFSGEAAAASPSDIEVARDCSRVTIKNRATVTAKVGLAVLTADATDETPVIDVLTAVLQKVVPQCTWPPMRPVTFAGLSLFGAPQDEATYADVLAQVEGQTWGDVKNLGVLDFAPAPGTGADSQALSAGVALLAALGWGPSVERPRAPVGLPELEGGA